MIKLHCQCAITRGQHLFRLIILSSCRPQPHYSLAQCCECYTNLWHLFVDFSMHSKFVCVRIVCKTRSQFCLIFFLHTMTILSQWLLVVVVLAAASFSFSLVLFWFGLVSFLSLRYLFVFSPHDSLFIYLHLMTISSSLSSLILCKNWKKDPLIYCSSLVCVRALESKVQKFWTHRTECAVECVVTLFFFCAANGNNFISN